MNVKSYFKCKNDVPIIIFLWCQMLVLTSFQIIILGDIYLIWALNIIILYFNQYWKLINIMINSPTTVTFYASQKWDQTICCSLTFNYVSMFILHIVSAVQLPLNLDPLWISILEQENYIKFIFVIGAAILFFVNLLPLTK